jgi:hypothetical protein
MPPVKADSSSVSLTKANGLSAGRASTSSRLRAPVAGASSRQRSGRTRYCGVHASRPKADAGSASRYDRLAFSSGIGVDVTQS